MAVFEPAERLDVECGRAGAARHADDLREMLRDAVGSTRIYEKTAWDDDQECRGTVLLLGKEAVLAHRLALPLTAELDKSRRLATHRRRFRHSGGRGVKADRNAKTASRGA
jgi:hypothetical protein